jgi:hypothetical protein
MGGRRGGLDSEVERLPFHRPGTARVTAREAADWKSAAKLVMVARVLAQKGPAPSGWESAVRLMIAESSAPQEAPADWKSAAVVKWAAKDIRHSVGFDVFWPRLQPSY